MKKHLKILVPFCIALVCAACGTSKAVKAQNEFDEGLAYADMGEYDQAIGHFTEAISLNPEFPDAYYHRGNAYRAKRDDIRALADYDQTIRLDPLYAEAYLKRGNVHRSRGDFDKAMEDYDEVFSQDLPGSIIIEDLITELDNYIESGKVNEKELESLEKVLNRLKEKNNVR